jgi:hypothetical protein
MRKQNTTAVCFRLDRDLVERLKETARLVAISTKKDYCYTDIIRSLIEGYHPLVGELLDTANYNTQGE